MAESPGGAHEAVLTAALPHVAFDGWTETTFRAAVADSAVPMAVARGLFPRGALDLAVAYHRRGDAQMKARLAAEDLAGLRFRDRVAHAVRLRLEIADDREAVRRGTTLFSLPQHAPEGARLIWGTADAIWTSLGDSSQDINWYTKRATLSAVYGATVLYWLGDDSPGHEGTWDFLDRRIGDVMQFEGAKARFRANPLGKALMAGPFRLLEKIRAPEPAQGLPGQTIDR